MAKFISFDVGWGLQPQGCATFGTKQADCQTLERIVSLMIVEVPDVIRPQAMKLVKEMAKAVEQRDADAYQKASVQLAAYLKFLEGTGDEE